jgi:Rrf2 family protein
MLALTRQVDYALIALAHLAERARQDAGPTSARELAELGGLPAPLTMKLLKLLARGRMVASTRGPQGGYTLALPPEQIALTDVVTAIEGPTRLTPCVGRLPIMGQGCELEAICPIRGPIRELNARLGRFLAGVSLADLIDPGEPETDEREAAALAAV